MLTIANHSGSRKDGDARTLTQIHDLLIQVMELFEARYGEQIDRFYENLHYEDQFEQQPAPEGDDQPF